MAWKLLQVIMGLITLEYIERWIPKNLLLVNSAVNCLADLHFSVSDAFTQPWAMTL